MPIAYAGGSTDVVCQGGASSQLNLGPIFPYTGATTATFTIIVNGNGFNNSTLVRFVSSPGNVVTNVTNFTLVSPQRIDIPMGPSGMSLGVGSYNIQLDSQAGQIVTTPTPYITMVTPGAAPAISISVSYSTAVDFAVSPISVSKDIVVQVANYDISSSATFAATPGALGTDFSYVAGTCAFANAAFAAGASCAFTLRFTPIAGGNRSYLTPLPIFSSPSLSINSLIGVGQ